jgi:arginase
MTYPGKPVVLMGAPTDVGAGHRGASLGPEALRVAGIGSMLRRLDIEVKDLGDLSGPRNPSDIPTDGYRHLKEVTAWCKEVYDKVDDALKAEMLPILMGGDHSLSIGSISAVADHCHRENLPLTVFWFDAHADFNTPKTSPTGNLHGMPVAVLCGIGPASLTGFSRTTPPVDSSCFIQLGVRSVDHIEKQAIADSDLTIFDMRTVDERGIRSVMAEALETAFRRRGHLHVSFDVDFLDPEIALGTSTPVAGGPSYREAQLCMEMIYDSGLMGSLDIMELNPADDIRNKTAHLVIELVASLFGEQILARHDPPQHKI